jgi:hypothetical protein
MVLRIPQSQENEIYFFLDAGGSSGELMGS